MEESKEDLRRKLLNQPIIKKKQFVVTATNPHNESKEAVEEKKQIALPQLYSSNTMSINRRMFDLINCLKVQECLKIGFFLECPI